MNIGIVVDWTKSGSELLMNTSVCAVSISFVENDIIRLRFKQGNNIEEQETFVVESELNLEDFEIVPAAEHY